MSKLKALGYGGLAISFFVTAWENWKGEKDTTLANAPPRRLPPPRPAGRAARRGIGTGFGVRNAPADDDERRRALGNGQVREVDVKNIKERVALIQDLICKGGGSKAVHEIASEIVSQKCRTSLGRTVWCVPEKDSLAETKAIFTAVRDPASKYAIRYTSDMLYKDVFTSAERTLVKKHSGDCDDFTIALGSLLLAIGHPVRVRVMQGVDRPSWSHVYLLTPRNHFRPDQTWLPAYTAKPPPDGVTVDGSMNRPLGWEPPGASQVAATGRPAGMVLRVRDFPVLCRK